MWRVYIPSDKCAVPGPILFVQTWLNKHKGAGTVHRESQTDFFTGHTVSNTPPNYELAIQYQHQAEREQR